MLACMTMPTAPARIVGLSADEVEAVRAALALAGAELTALRGAVGLDPFLADRFQTLLEVLATTDADLVRALGRAGDPAGT